MAAFYAQTFELRVVDGDAASGFVRLAEIHRYGTIAFCEAIDPEGNVIQITTRS